MSKDKELSNLHLEPLPPVIPSPPPPCNPTMASMQYSLSTLEGRTSQKIVLQSLIVASLSGTLRIVEPSNQHSFTTLKDRPSQNKCLQSNYSKLKLALTIAVLAVVMITVPVVYTSFINQKTEVPNINTSGLTQRKVPIEMPSINTTEIPNINNINTTETPNINTSVLMQITDLPTVNSNLISGGMYIIFFSTNK